MMTLLDVPNAANKSRQSSDNKTSPKRRPQELLDVRRARMSDNGNDGEYDADRHYYVPPPNRGKLQTPAQSEPRSSTDAEKRSKQLAAGNLSPRPAAKKPTYSTQTSHDNFTYPRRGSYRLELNDKDDDDRPRSCDAMIPETVKPILSVGHHHDCSMETVRSFVSGMGVRRSGGPVVGGRAGCSTEVLLDMIDEDVAEAAGSKNVRFAPVVCVCDHTSTISYCHLRHQSASSAPAVLGGGSCALPTLSCGGCVGSGPQPAVSRGDKPDLPTVVDRYMMRCERQRQHLDDSDWPRSDDVHRFPPLRRRRT